MSSRPYYLSPEVCQAQKYSYKSDVWALGCILYELCALQQAWTGNNLLNIVYKITMAQQPPIHTTYSGELQQLVTELLTKDPALRPSLSQVLSRP